MIQNNQASKSNVAGQIAWKIEISAELVFDYWFASE